ncbi:MAG: hypothetical protein J5710_09810 [Treponema sp.]|nr:hypothetical protein [Treponema sp.]
MSNQNNFLNSIINENNAEYNILYSIRNQCGTKNYLLEMYNISEIKNYAQKIVSYISEVYKSFEIRLFSLNINNDISDCIISNPTGNTDGIEFLINESRRISKANNTYILVNCNTNFFLVYKGEIVESFSGIIENKNSLMQRKEERLDIDHLEEAFENYMSHKRHNGCSYVKKVDNKPKIIDDISEQKLRNDLFRFLERRTKLHVFTEYNTSLTHDEESVDIGLINENDDLAIIEVKFFIEKGAFVSNDKNSVYSITRFQDGYEQLCRYCNHLDEDRIYKIRFAYLYMFYAHSMSKDELKNESENLYNNFLKSHEKMETEKIRQHYKTTILDNMLDIVA